MGIFDGVLLCSDWDGTLHTKTGLNQIDIEAIQYFQSNGGKFTICSGRYLPHLTQFFDKIMPNTYVITLNGAIIIDPTTEEKLYEGYLGTEAVGILDRLIIDKDYFVKMNIYFDNEPGATMFEISDYKKYRERLLINPAYKSVLIADKREDVLRAKKDIYEFDLGGHTLMSSWSTSLELLKEDNGKGAAIKRLKDVIGAKISIAVGDFENDIPMLISADIGYAVGNALESVKAVADRITVNAENGALSRIIRDLEKELSQSAE